VGTCVGTLHPADLILGRSIRPGDAIVGLMSSGLHSNGYTLARRVLLKDAGLPLDRVIDELGCRLGDALLEPTLIYVRAVYALWDAGIETRGLSHVTGDGLANLTRLDSDVGYEIDDLEAPPPIFELIQRRGGIDEAEMFRVFNMGVGLVAIVREEDAGRAIELVEAAGYRARRIGTVTDRTGTVTIAQHDLVGGLEGGDSFFAAQPGLGAPFRAET
jgi:phosphoribosylformylglycinamidine cyclo-ligase